MSTIKSSTEHLTLNADGSGKDLKLQTNGTERVIVKSTGDVGIGTSSPTAVLDVRRGDASGKIAEFHNNVGYGIELGTSTAEAYIKAGYNQDLLFKTGSTATERLRIQSGGGISFNGDTAAANALDDYEEGTWTPTVTAGASSLTYNLQAGTYTKIGSLVSIQGVLSFSTFTGNVNFLNVSLPFASLGISALWVQGTLLVDNLTLDKKQVNAQNSPGTSSIIAVCNGGSTATHSGIPGNQFSVSSAIRFNISFRV